MDAIDRFGQELVLAGRRRHARWWALPARFGTRFARTWSRRRVSAHVRVALIALALVLATSAITLAATGVILTGSPVGTARAPIATVGEGAPVRGGARLLPLRAPDPAGGLHGECGSSTPRAGSSACRSAASMTASSDSSGSTARFTTTGAFTRCPQTRSRTPLRTRPDG